MLLTILKKDLKLFFSDKRAAVLTFILPIFLISLFALAFGSIGDDSKPKKIKILVVDEDETVHSKSTIGALDSLQSVTLITVEKQKGLDFVSKGKYSSILILGKGFQDSIMTQGKLPMELKYDATKEIEIRMLQSVLTQNLMTGIGKAFMQKKFSDYFDKNFPEMPNNIRNSIASEFNSSDNGLAPNGNLSLKMTPVIKQEEEKGNLGLIQAVAGTAIMMLLFSISNIGGGLLDEKEAGTLKRLLSSPIRPNDILFGKMLAAFILSILQLAIMFIFAWLVFGLPIFTDVLALILMVLTIAFAVSSFGMFLVAIAKTRQQLQSLSTIIILVMSAVGGSMIPLFVMPEIMQKVAVISVNYWGIQGFYDIFWRNLPLVEILPKMLVLTGIGLFMTLLSTRLLKKSILNIA